MKDEQLRGEDGRDRFQFETILTDLSTRFINMPVERVDAEIVEAQRRVCECLGFELSVLWQLAPEASGLLVMTHLYRPIEGPPVPETMLASEYFPWAFAQVMAGRCFVVPSMDEIPEGAGRDAEVWKHYGLRNVATFPLAAGGGSTFGAVSFHDVTKTRVWTENLLKRLELVAAVFANAILRKRSEQALRESEERLLLATAAAGSGLWVLDAASHRFWITPKTAELLGRPPGDELEIGHFFDLVLPEDRAAVRAAMDRAVGSSDMAEVEYRIVRPDGSVRWMRSSGRMTVRAKGDPAQLMGITAEITELKQREDALRSSESRVSSAIEIAGMGFYEFAENGSTTFMDAHLRNMLGLPTDEAVDIRAFWLAHIHPEHRPQILAASQKVLGGTVDRISASYRYMHPAGQQRWFLHLSRALARNDAGGLRRGMGVVWDITERKHAEVEAAELRRELAHVARAYTLGELASSMAHELNQPLAAIIANADAAEIHARSPCPDIAEIHDILDDIRRDGLRAGETIHRMRAFLQRREVEMQPLDVEQLVRESVRFVEMDAGVRRIALEFQVEPDLRGHGDRIQLQQVLLNLLVNGMDAMNGSSEGTRQLSVDARRISPDMVGISVSDSGHGIPAEKLAEIFEPFFTTKSNGLGMGLAISRSIVEAHGGRIWLENNPEGGATARFTLPISARGAGP